MRGGVNDERVRLRASRLRGANSNSRRRVSRRVSEVEFRAVREFVERRRGRDSGVSR